MKPQKAQKKTPEEFSREFMLIAAHVSLHTTAMLHVFAQMEFKESQPLMPDLAQKLHIALIGGEKSIKKLRELMDSVETKH